MGGQPGLLLVLGSEDKAQHKLTSLPHLLWSGGSSIPLRTPRENEALWK